MFGLLQTAKVFIDLSDQAKRDGHILLFVLRIIKDHNEEYNKRRIYYNGNDAIHAAINLFILNEKTEGKAIVELWANNESIPVGVIRGITQDKLEDECGSCKYANCCQSKDDDHERVQNCKMMAEYTGQPSKNVREEKESETEIFAGKQNPSEQKTSEPKPSGLSGDTSLSDMIIELEKSMREKKK